MTTFNHSITDCSPICANLFLSMQVTPTCVESCHGINLSSSDTNDTNAISHSDFILVLAQKISWVSQHKFSMFMISFLVLKWEKEALA